MDERTKDILRRAGYGEAEGPREITTDEIRRLVDEVPDVDDPEEINYWVERGDFVVYLEGWSDKCLAGTGFPPMEEGGTTRKLAYIRDLTPGILERKAEERGLTLVRGGFLEREDASALYGVTYGVYRRPSGRTGSESAVRAHGTVEARGPFGEPRPVAWGIAHGVARGLSRRFGVPEPGVKFMFLFWEGTEGRFEKPSTLAIDDTLAEVVDFTHPKDRWARFLRGVVAHEFGHYKQYLDGKYELLERGALDSFELEREAAELGYSYSGMSALDFNDMRERLENIYWWYMLEENPLGEAVGRFDP